MKYVQALISVGLFGWLGWAVLTDNVPGGDGGASKTRVLQSIVGSATERFGVEGTGFGLIAVGLVLATFFLLRRA